MPQIKDRIIIDIYDDTTRGDAIGHTLSIISSGTLADRDTNYCVGRKKTSGDIVMADYEPNAHGHTFKIWTQKKQK